MLDFSRLYQLGSYTSPTALHVHVCDSSRGYEEDYQIFRGKAIPASPITFEYRRNAGGGTPCDLVTTDGGPGDLISDRFVSVLKPYTGWGTYPVHVFGRAKRRLEGYHGLAVTGRCGPIDASRSRLTWHEPRVAIGKPFRILKGLYFDEESWDGSDIFSPEGTGIVIVVAAVRDAVEVAGITNVSFKSLSDCDNHVSKPPVPRIIC